MSMIHKLTYITLAIIGSLSFVLIAGGCAGDRGSRTTKGTGSDRATAIDRGQHALPRNENGLEYRRYVIVDQHIAMARFLSPFVLGNTDDENDDASIQSDKTTPSVSQVGQPTGLPTAAQVRAWRENGLRIAVIPMNQLNQLMESIPREPVHESTWVGQASGWTPVAEGSPIQDSRIFQIQGEELYLKEGRFQLMVRSWIMQSTGDSKPQLRIELLPRLWVENKSLFAGAMGQPREHITYMPELAAAFNLTGSHAIAILSEDPFVSWSSLMAPERGTQGDNPSDDSVEDPADKPNHVDILTKPIGPQPIPILTVGEELLQTSDGRKRLLVVFIPRLTASAQDSP